ncbi:hypothetical protein X975_08641, partial [Stegodyphus mimosarum]
MIAKATTIFILVTIALYSQRCDAQTTDENCPPEWSFVHQCWKSFEVVYMQLGNDTEVAVKQQEVQDMCSCMAKAVTQGLTNAIVNVDLLKK